MAENVKAHTFHSTTVLFSDQQGVAGSEMRQDFQVRASTPVPIEAAIN